jgi:F-box/leucine-rich repeat protein 2/20
VNLVHLDVSGLTELVDDNLIEILALHASKLQVLDLKACTKLTDKSICAVAVKCPIQSFVLSGINNLTDKIIFAIANHLQFSLKEIYLSGCTKITSVALRYLADCCINHLFCEHRVPNLDPNQLMAKNLDSGNFVRVDQFDYRK